VLTSNSQQRSGKTCDGVSRRNLLKVGGLCVGGLTLADLLRVQAQEAPARRASAKAVIMVWLEGGPSHIDTYDLKLNAPEEIRGPYKPIKTKVPGMEICELLPQQRSPTSWPSSATGRFSRMSIGRLTTAGGRCICWMTAARLRS